MPTMNSGLGFDLFSYGRRGPAHRDRLSPTEVAQIVRTVHRAPEVMVKVLTQGATDLGAVRKHLDYIGRKGEVDLETDERLEGSPDYVKTQYRAKMERHLEQLREKTQAAGMGYHLLVTNRPLDLALTEYLSLRRSGHTAGLGGA